jgi:hypothetical protein
MTMALRAGFCEISSEKFLSRASQRSIAIWSNNANGMQPIRATGPKHWHAGSAAPPFGNVSYDGRWSAISTAIRLAWKTFSDVLLKSQPPDKGWE